MPEQNVSQTIPKFVIKHLFVALQDSRFLPSGTGKERLFLLGTGGQ